mgnify:CR=1 FL=1
MLKRVRVIAWVLVGSTVVLVAISYGLQQFMSPPPTAQQATRSAITGKFSLIDHTGKSVMEQDFRGKWTLVFFGFTYCPDVCPTTLDKVARLMNRLEKDGENIWPLFISVDPERDKPAVLKKYVAAFHPRIVGLTGTAEQVKAATDAFKVYYAKVKQKTAPDGYTMDHSAFLYFMNPKGQYQAHFSHHDGVEKIAKRIRGYLGN